MRQQKRILALTAAALVTVISPLTVLADNPEFAHDEATWARLRDNVMEYDELSMLVEEYNPNYLNNQTTYRDNRSRDNARETKDKKYEDANDLYDAADDIRSAAEDLNDADMLMIPGMASVYSGLIASAVMTEQNALQMKQAADVSYEDSEMESLNYQNTQLGLIVQVQGMFASYNLMKKSIGTIEKQIELLQAGLGAQERQVQLGMATQTDLLTAQKNLQSAQSSYTELQATVESLRQKLCIATGWQYNDQPEIQDLPGADPLRIDTMNPDTDAQAALDNSLTLKYNRRALGNMAEGSADRKNMERTIKNQEENIKAGIRNLYNDAVQKRIALQLAESAMATETASMNAANTKYQLGMISNLEYLQVQSSFYGKQIELETADMNLQQAIETYEWALKGYMNN